MEDHKGLNEMLGENKQTLNIPTTKPTQAVEDLKFLGDALNDKNIDDYIFDEIPVINVLVGYVGNGKTTFVTTLIQELMTTGCIGKSYFVDTDTMTGFEKRAYIRNADLITKNRSERTSLLDNYLLTLDIKDGLEGDTRKIIISDCSGEVYQNYQSDSELVKKDLILHHASRIFFFIDAVEFNDKELALTNNYKQLTERFKFAGIFDSNVEIYVITTKVDQIIAQDKMLEQKINVVSKDIEIVSGKNIGKVFLVNSLVCDDALKAVYTKLLESKITSPPNNGEELNWVAKILNEEDRI